MTISKCKACGRVMSSADRDQDPETSNDPRIALGVCSPGCLHGQWDFEKLLPSRR